MLGACRVSLLDAISESGGAFLPLALEGFSMQSKDFPESFICRYRLPVAFEPNKRIASTAFEVISHSGELLASCDKYSVVWIDMSIPQQSRPLPGRFSFQQVWMPKELIAKPRPNSKILYFGKQWLGSTRSRTLSTSIFSLTVERPNSLSIVLETFEILPDCTIILNASHMDDAPDSSSFSPFWQSALLLMKALGKSKKRTFRFIVLSTAPVSVASTAPPVLGTMIQGMLRVFRTEVGLDNAHGIELPGDAAPGIVAEVLAAELRSSTKEYMVSYRYSRLPGESAVRLRRFVPELRPLVGENGDVDVRLSGVAAIVGMGSIGFALGLQMIAAGSSSVVFIGRRPATDAKVAQQLSTLAGTSGRFAYIQGDVSDLNALRGVLEQITTTYGPGAIKSIIHTAASVSDATIDSVPVDAFDRVLRPKVHGAYNLHLLTVELDLHLDSFVLFSSISVPLGNQGQVAYVAANAFLDSLAAYRRSIGLPGVSLQLGPWESELMDNLARSSATAAVVHTISHKDGLPLIFRALSSSVPVQVIAALDVQTLSRIPVYASDTLFAGLVADVDAPKSRMLAMSSTDVAKSVVSILRVVLELKDLEPLDLNESLSACGIDSIAYGQIRTAVMKKLGVDVPLVYLSDAFSLNDIIGNIQESVLKQANALST
ncbi:KR domain-containing protein [Mycena leptocephala]|nr:KR domain-containing protein [Mycena leptocephala]